MWSTICLLNSLFLYSFNTHDWQKKGIVVILGHRDRSYLKFLKSVFFFFFLFTDIISHWQDLSTAFSHLPWRLLSFVIYLFIYFFFLFLISYKLFLLIFDVSLKQARAFTRATILLNPPCSIYCFHQDCHLHKKKKREND